MADSMKLPRSVESTPIDGVHLAVEFYKSGDRFGHVIRCVSGLGEWVVAQSMEGDEHTSWPSSPPIQQLDACPLAGGRSGLVGVGMAGSGHWSISVEDIEERGDDQQLRCVGVEFDVACRSAEFGALLSTYQFGESIEAAWPEEADAEVVELQVPAGDGLPVVRCLPVAPLGRLRESGGDQSEQALWAVEPKVAAKTADGVSDGGTRRWKYRFEILA